MERHDEPILVSLATAVRMVEEAASEDGNGQRTIHTFIAAGDIDLGADWAVTAAVEYLTAADPIGFAPHPARHELAAAHGNKVVYFNVQCPAGFASDVSDDDLVAAEDAAPGQYAERRRAYVQEVVPAMVKEHGWMLQSVFPDEGSATPPFTYTVGLTSKGRAELIVIGLPDQMAGAVLNHAAAQHVTTPIVPGSLVDVEYSVQFRAVAAGPATVTEWACIAGEVYGDDPVTVIQLLWPDKDGIYPNDPGWSIAGMQPLLADPAEVN